jgi:Flp pilus assembly pilin Flp
MEYTLIVAAICVVIYVTAKLLIDEIDEIDVLESIGVFN